MFNITMGIRDLLPHCNNRKRYECCVGIGSGQVGVRVSFVYFSQVQ